MCVRLTALLVRPPLRVHLILKRRNVCVCVYVSVKKKFGRACSVRRCVISAETLVVLKTNVAKTNITCDGCSE